MDSKITYEKLLEQNPNTIQRLFRLTELNLSHSKLTRLDANIFFRLENLKKLELSNNQLKEIDANVFDPLGNLTWLDLSSNQLKFLEPNLFYHLTNLTVLNLSNNQLTRLNVNIFKRLVSLEILALSDNRLKEIEANLFDSLAKLNRLYLSNNQYQALSSNVFNQLNSLNTLDISNNHLNELDENIFNTLPNLTCLVLSNCSLQQLHFRVFERSNNLQKLYISNNQLKALDLKFFKQLENLTTIDISNNNLKQLSQNLFDGLTHLKRLYLNNTNLTELKSKVFDHLQNLEELHISNNQLKSLEVNIFNKLVNLKILNLANNQLKNIDVNLYKNLFHITDINVSDNFLSGLDPNVFNNLINLQSINFTKNFDNNNFDNLFKSLFDEIFIKDFNSDLNKLYFSDRYDSTLCIARKSIMGNSLEKLFLLYLNNSVFNLNEVKIFDDSNSKSFSFKLNMLKQFEFTILDYLISLDDYDSSYIIHFKDYVDSLLRENKSIKNLEFKLKSEETMPKICERNDLLLFGSFFLDSNGYVCESNEYIYDEKEFYSKIDLARCFKMIIENNNERLAINLIKLLENILEKYGMIENVKEFNAQLITDFLSTIFKNKWFRLAETILDVSQIDKTFILIENNHFNSKNLKTNAYNKLNQNELIQMDDNESYFSEALRQNISYEDNHTVYFDSKSLDTTMYASVIESDNKINASNEMKNILELIRESDNTALLLHKTTKDILDKKWKRIPRNVYYLNLILYLTFLIIYSINIEYYKLKTFDSFVLITKIIGCLLLTYFILLEFIQLGDSIYHRKCKEYLADFKNTFEILNFPLCFATLLLSNNEFKSTLYAVTIVISYIILLFRLNKVFEMGPVVHVFINITRRSIKLALVILILLLGFLLSIRNRSKSFWMVSSLNQTGSNDLIVKKFEGSFGSTFFEVLKMFLGGLETEGIDNEMVDLNGFVNFFICSLFIFLMPVLFINVFTAISIDEIQKFIQMSQAKNVAIKIDYVIKFDSILLFKWIRKRLFNYHEIRDPSKESTKTISKLRREKILADNLDCQNLEILNILNKNSTVVQRKFDFLEKSLSQMQRDQANLEQNFKKIGQNLEKFVNGFNRKKKNVLKRHYKK